jgi:hypothetical protein
MWLDCGFGGLGLDESGVMPLRTAGVVWKLRRVCFCDKNDVLRSDFCDWTWGAAARNLVMESAVRRRGGSAQVVMARGVQESMVDGIYWSTTRSYENPINFCQKSK